MFTVFMSVLLILPLPLDLCFFIVPSVFHATIQTLAKAVAQVGHFHCKYHPEVQVNFMIGVLWSLMLGLCHCLCLLQSTEEQ